MNAQIDPYLQNLVELAKKHELQIPVWVLVNDTYITGKLVSNNIWATLYADLTANVDPFDFTDPPCLTLEPLKEGSEIGIGQHSAVGVKVARIPLSQISAWGIHLD